MIKIKSILLRTRDILVSRLFRGIVLAVYLLVIPILILSPKLEHFAIDYKGHLTKALPATFNTTLFIK